jgi:uncharacterized protein DUF4177
MFEYKVVSSAGLPTEVQLNELANEGWDLVQIVQNLISRDRFEYAVYLRRRELSDAN